jgi:hypothetical protein
MDRFSNAKKKKDFGASWATVKANLGCLIFSKEILTKPPVDISRKEN